MPDLGTVIVFVAGLIGGFLVSVSSSAFINGRANERAKKNAKIDLLSEIKQNQQHQSLSIAIRLEDDAYKRLCQNGFVLSLDVRTQNLLRDLYSFIHMKNELVAVFLETRGAVEIPGWRTAQQIRDDLNTAQNKITSLLSELIILFEDDLGIRRG